MRASAFAREGGACRLRFLPLPQVSEKAEELRAVELPFLLRSEQVIRAVVLAFTEPSAESTYFVEQWLPAMWVERLDSPQRALEKRLLGYEPKRSILVSLILLPLALPPAIFSPFRP